MSLNVLYAVCTVNDLQLIISEQSLAGGNQRERVHKTLEKHAQTHTNASPQDSLKLQHKISSYLICILISLKSKNGNAIKTVFLYL